MATAHGAVHISPETATFIQKRKLSKGDVLSVAQLAGIMGAKKTPDIIRLCHTVSLSSVPVELTVYDMCKAVDKGMEISEIF